MWTSQTHRIHGTGGIFLPTWMVDVYHVNLGKDGKWRIPYCWVFETFFAQLKNEDQDLNQKRDLQVSWRNTHFWMHDFDLGRIMMFTFGLTRNMLWTFCKSCQKKNRVNFLLWDSLHPQPPSWLTHSLDTTKNLSHRHGLKNTICEKERRTALCVSVQNEEKPQLYQSKVFQNQTKNGIILSHHYFEFGIQLKKHATISTSPFPMGGIPMFRSVIYKDHFRTKILQLHSPKTSISPENWWLNPWNFGKKPIFRSYLTVFVTHSCIYSNLTNFPEIHPSSPRFQSWHCWWATSRTVVGPMKYSYKLF